MALKSVREFNEFNYKRFFEGKQFGFMSVVELIDENKKVIGSKVAVVIKEDGTVYRNGEKGLNEGKQFDVKVLGRYPKEFEKYQMFVTDVVVFNVEKAVIYGDFQNEVSFTANVLSKEDAARLQAERKQQAN